MSFDDEYDQNKDSTPDEQTEVAPDPTEAAEPIEAGTETVSEENDISDFGTVELGEPEPPVLASYGVKDVFGNISLDQSSGFYASCSNPDCVNFEKVEEVVAVTDNPQVRCGPCGQMITDLAAI